MSLSLVSINRLVQLGLENLTRMSLKLSKNLWN